MFALITANKQSQSNYILYIAKIIYYCPYWSSLNISEEKPLNQEKWVEKRGLHLRACALGKSLP